jgi:hypothetical protein
MGYLVTEQQFNQLHRTRDQLELLAQLAQGIKTPMLEVQTSVFISTMFKLSEELQTILAQLPYDTGK